MSKILNLISGKNDLSSEVSRSQEYRYFRSVVPLRRISVDTDSTKSWICYDAGPREVECPLIFLPPVSGTADVFFLQLIYLMERGYRAIAVEYPTYWTLQEFVHGFLKLLDHLKLDRVVAKSKKLFFICTDIQDCYPSIDQERLYELILTKMKAVNILENDRIKVKEVDVVDSGRKVSKHFSIKEDLQWLADSRYRSDSIADYCVVVPKKTSTLTIKSIELLFRNYIHQPFIRVGPKRWYRLCKGIRQGGSLSSALCSLYITDILDKVIGDFGQRDEEARLIVEDDIVFITSSLDRAKAALDAMANDFPKFGLQINFNKLRFNFRNSQSSIGFSEDFTFLGRKICLREGSIVTDYSKYNGEKIKYSFGCDPFISIRKILKNIIDQLNLAIVSWDLNAEINCKKAIVINVYERCLLQFARLACYILLSPFYRSRQTPNSLHQFSQSLSRKIVGISEKLSRESKFVSMLTKPEVEWIVNQSAYHLWSMKCLRHRKKELKQLKSMLIFSKKMVKKRKRRTWLRLFHSSCNLKLFSDSLK